ncbi:diguanylate cyclase [Lysobacter sp. CA199]|uniref:diguanylate cyclase n=1 Tax=Lysobacter sp. CA199 TaxID=3455608 RepID=UPI003F8D86CA
MESLWRRIFQIAVLVLASALTVGATESAPITLAELSREVADPSPEAVLSGHYRDKFHTVPGDEIQLRTKQARWWRLTAVRDVSASQSPQLVMSAPYWKQLEVWRPGDAKGVRRSVYGPDTDLTHSSLAHVVPLPNGLRAGESIYIRVSSANDLASRITIAPLAQVYEQDVAFGRMWMFVLTSLGIVAILAVAFWLCLRQRGYAYLALTLLAQMATLAIEGGEFRGTQWLATFAMDRRTNILLNTAAVWASVRFLIFFLSLPTHQPRISRLLNVCSVILGAIIVVSTVQVWYATAIVGNFVLLVVIGAVVAAGARAIRRRQREAYVLLAAWSPLIVVIVIRVGALYRWWPYFDWLQFAYPASLTVGGLGLLSGLTLKLYQLSRDSDAARHRATYDGLTGVLSRAALDDAMQVAVAVAHGSGTPLSIVFIDIDRFKHINDTYGHAVGDEVLRIVSLRTRNRLRPDDLCGRYGGDEMIVAFVGAPLAEAVQLAEHLREAVANTPLSIGGALIPISLSLGVAQLRETESSDDVIRRADLALYASKTGGRGRVSADEIPAIPSQS